uniref:SHSP domain-containing protein n=1 Tax=Parastrongyloides trichosuri TaxID=131310 RepID=A0A0N4ZW96_PARTI
MAPNSQTIRQLQRHSPPAVVGGSLYSNKLLPLPIYKPLFSNTKYNYTSEQESTNKYQENNYCGNNKNNTNQRQFTKKENTFDYTSSVKEMDQELTKIRETPSKIICERKKITVIIDMSNFKPEDIEVQVEKGRLIVAAEQEINLNTSTTVIKKFVRKFVIPDDVRNEFISTELDSKGKLKIVALRAIQ